LSVRLQSRDSLGWEPLLRGGSRQAALQFGSTEGLDSLIDQFWSDPLLQGVPRIHVGANTVIVPATVVEHLRQTGHELPLNNAQEEKAFEDVIEYMQAQRRKRIGVADPRRKSGACPSP
jgi:hypothetical protein